MSNISTSDQLFACHVLDIFQGAGLVVLNSLKSSVFSKDICDKIVKYMSSQPNFVVRNVLW